MEGSLKGNEYNTARPQSGVTFVGDANGGGVGTINRCATLLLHSGRRRQCLWLGKHLHGDYHMPKIDYKPINDDDKLPVCPHCEKEIRTMRYFEQPGVMALKVSRLFVCPHCLKVLGIGTVGM
jgi:hypothetical protein